MSLSDHKNGGTKSATEEDDAGGNDRWESGVDDIVDEDGVDSPVLAGNKRKAAVLDRIITHLQANDEHTISNEFTIAEVSLVFTLMVCVNSSILKLSNVNLFMILLTF